ncbi:hypothetical protein BG000_007640 [Podila horticola]|nr:hypothetical protein BG000_007640 [Podila horticola]
MPSITCRTFIISTYALYIASDSYCNVASYLKNRSDFFAWFFPDLLGIILLAANVFRKQSYTPNINNNLAHWTFLIGWLKSLWNAALLLHAIVDGYTPELDFYRGPHGGMLGICVSRDTYGEPYEFEGQQKIPEWNTMMCDYIIVRWVVHGLNLVHTAVLLIFLTNRVWRTFT